MTTTHDLLLQATRELLEGWVGPVWGVPPGYEPQDGAPAVLLGLDQHDGWAVCGPAGRVYMVTSRLYLDLSRAECRDRVARVVVAYLNPERTRHRRMGGEWHSLESSGPAHTVLYQHRHSEDDDPAGWAALHTHCRGCGRGHSVGQEWMLPYVDGKYVGEGPLLDLDPNDDTRLPDGSRVVDAKALLYVARAVLGGSA